MLHLHVSQNVVFSRPIHCALLVSCTLTACLQAAFCTSTEMYFTQTIILFRHVRYVLSADCCAASVQYNAAPFVYLGVGWMREGRWFIRILKCWPGFCEIFSCAPICLSYEVCKQVALSSQTSTGHAMQQHIFYQKTILAKGYRAQFMAVPMYANSGTASGSWPQCTMNRFTMSINYLFIVQW